MNVTCNPVVFNLTNLLGECVGGNATHVAAKRERSEHTPKKLYQRDNHHNTLG